MDMGRVREAAEELAGEVLLPVCVDFGVVVADSVDRARIPVLTHDERGAPLQVNDSSLLVSLTDEENVCVYVWARPRYESGLLGVGIDLASACDFAGQRGERFNTLIFSGAEQAFVHAHYAGREEMGFALAFSAKEAAFKSLAAPLRAWYEEQDEELEFEVREFELVGGTHARGTLRHAYAQAAMDALGVRSIEVAHCETGDAVLTLALALRGPALDTRTLHTMGQERLSPDGR